MTISYALAQNGTWLAYNGTNAVFGITRYALSMVGGTTDYSPKLVARDVIGVDTDLVWCTNDKLYPNRTNFKSGFTGTVFETNKLMGIEDGSAKNRRTNRDLEKLYMRMPVNKAILWIYLIEDFSISASDFWLKINEPNVSARLLVSGDATKLLLPGSTERDSSVVAAEIEGLCQNILFLNEERDGEHVISFSTDDQSSAQLYGRTKIEVASAVVTLAPEVLRELDNWLLSVKSGNNSPEQNNGEIPEELVTLIEQLHYDTGELLEAARNNQHDLMLSVLGQLRTGSTKLIKITKNVGYAATTLGVGLVPAVGLQTLYNSMADATIGVDGLLGMTGAIATGAFAKDQLDKSKKKG